MSQIFATPQILCLHIIIIYLIFIGPETPQHDWKIIEGSFEYKLGFCYSEIADNKKQNKTKQNKTKTHEEVF